MPLASKEIIQQNIFTDPRKVDDDVDEDENNYTDEIDIARRRLPFTKESRHDLMEPSQLKLSENQN